MTWLLCKRRNIELLQPIKSRKSMFRAIQLRHEMHVPEGSCEQQYCWSDIHLRSVLSQPYHEVPIIYELSSTTQNNKRLEEENGRAKEKKKQTSYGLCS